MMTSPLPYVFCADTIAFTCLLFIPSSILFDRSFCASLVPLVFTFLKDYNRGVSGPELKGSKRNPLLRGGRHAVQILQAKYSGQTLGQETRKR